MLSVIRNQTAVEELLWTLEREIMQRTLARVRDLQVEQEHNRIVIRGFTSSYFIKQLTIQAALDVLGDAVGRELDLDVQLVVLGSSPLLESGADRPTRVT
jgi:hypothetical protein